MDLFFIFIIIAILSYGIQLPLLIKYARELDGLTTTIYRNLSLIITMAPMLFFAPAEDFAMLPEYVWLLILASGFGVLSFTLTLMAATYLPIGIAHSIRQVVYTTFAVILGFSFLKERLSFTQLTVILVMLAGVVLLVFSKPDTKHLKKKNVPLGLLFVLGAGISTAASFMVYSFVSREISPFIAGYFWEAFIGIFAILLGLGRYVLLKIKTPVLPWRDSLKIALISMTTISGTLCYGFAINNGPYSLAAALMTMTGIINLIAGYVLFGEKLSKKQIGLVIFLIGCIIALKIIVSGG